MPCDSLCLIWLWRPSGVFSPFLRLCRPFVWKAVCTIGSSSVGYRLPRRTTEFGLEIRPVASMVCPGLTGVMTASGTGGIGLTSGAGFFVREMVGGGFFGMELIMPSLRLEIKSEGLVGWTVMPSSRGMYRSRHPSASRSSEAGRSEYVECLGLITAGERLD
jgi:hypothetical protein